MYIYFTLQKQTDNSSLMTLLYEDSADITMNIQWTLFVRAGRLIVFVC